MKLDIEGSTTPIDINIDPSALFTIDRTAEADISGQLTQVEVAVCPNQNNPVCS